jgi:hypothetical protein
MTTQLPETPRSSLIDPRTGQMAREWIRFFDDLRRAIVAGLDDSVGGRLDALEADTVFDSGSGGSDGSGSYNDSAIRARIEQLETDLLFPPPAQRSESENAEVEARLALLEQTSDDASLQAIFAPDRAAELADLTARMHEIEVALTMIDDASARLRLLLHRVQSLEVEGLFP